jgi:hypothetical protein
MIPNEFSLRHGDHGAVTEENFDEVVARLLADLRFEHYEAPDDEHTQVSIHTEHWSVTLDVSGLVVFDNFDLLEGQPSDLPETMYLRDLSDDQARQLWRAVVDNDRAALLSFPWQSSSTLAAYVRDFYRDGL